MRVYVVCESAEHPEPVAAYSDEVKAAARAADSDDTGYYVELELDSGL